MTVKIDHLAFSVVISAVLGFITAYFFLQPQIDNLQEEVALRPPVIVVDMAKLAIDALPVGSPKEDIQRHFEQTQLVIEKFKSAGFLVLPRETIISVPDDLMLTTADVEIGRSSKETPEDE